MTDPKANNSTLSYDGFGRLVYDAAGRITQRDYRTRADSPSGNIADSDTFTHDDAGRLLSATKGRYGNTLAFSHDAAGRISDESLTAHSQTYTVGRHYDAVGQLVQIDYPDGSTTVTRDYTARDELQQAKQGANSIASFTYDNGGRETSRNFANGLTTNTTWLNDNRVDTIANTAVGTHDYSYDANGNRTAAAISGAMSGYGWSTGASGYDKDDRLINWDRTDGNLDQDWNLSKVGDWDTFTVNAAAQSRTHGPAHELTAIATQPLTYDARGNLASDNQSRGFVWDADNHLKSVNVSTGAPVGQVGTHTYEYDALGRRVSKTTGSATIVFVSLTQPIPPLGTTGGQVIAEYAAGTAATNPLRETIFGSYVDEPLAIIDSPTNTTHYYHQNARYDVLALSDTAGTIVERYAYDAYGDTIILDGTGTTQRTTSQYTNRFAFTGRELDAESGLYYFRARYYDGRMGRFVGRDPVSYRRELNLYAYVVDNVLSTVDPSGLDSFYRGFSIGATVYKGVGGGITFDFNTKTEPCCVRGVPGTKTVYDGRLHGEVGIGLGVDFRLATLKASAQFTVVTVNVDVGVACSTPCAAPGAPTSCCRYCTDIGVNLPAPGVPIRSLSIGLGIGIDVSASASGSFRICYSFSGCPKPGLAVGFCGGISVEASASLGFAVVGAQKDITNGCVSLYGTDDMLSW